MYKKVFFSLALAATGFANAQNVNIPDANFKAYLVGDSTINTNGDNEIQVSEALAFTGTINCSNRNIISLTGIEAFVNLSALRCQGNKLETLNVTQNTVLNELNCAQNLSLIHI